MEALQPSFMLPPNFRFPPNGHIQVGMLLTDGPKKGVPNPNKPWNVDSRVAPTSVQTDPQPEFHYEGANTANTKAGIWVDAATLVEIGFGGERGHDYHLRVDTGPVETTTFVPDETYIANALRLEPLLKEHTKRPACKPVYMVTGIMIATSATIEVQTDAHNMLKAKVMLDANGFGVPVKIGPEFERETTQSRAPTYTLPQPFILAYELWKIQKKWTGGFTQTIHDAYALWDDSSERSAESQLQADWETGPYVPESK